jgi:hypothetical protein
MVALSPLLALGLHLVPLLLLVRVEKSADLCVGGLANIHHLAAPILL